MLTSGLCVHEHTSARTHRHSYKSTHITHTHTRFGLQRLPIQSTMDTIIFLRFQQLSPSMQLRKHYLLQYHFPFKLD